MVDPEGSDPHGHRQLSVAASDVLAPDTEEFRLSLPIGLGAVLAAGASLITCYAGILTGYAFNIDWPMINPHVQAVLMWGFAVVAVVFLWRDRRRHENNLSLIIGGLAAIVLVATLYAGYDERIEAMAYALLVIGALLNQVLLLGSLNSTVRAQAIQIEALNHSLSNRVKQQEGEIDRLGRLRQFLPSQVADIVVAEDNDAMLESHRRYIACLFCDIRNFTAISEAAEPEEVIGILQQFHDDVGVLVAEQGGTIGYRSGDGLMVFFNDPVPCDDPVLRAVKLAMDVQVMFERIRTPWKKLGHDIGLGIGIASGYATLGLVGFHGRADYTAIGGVVNTASRLCDIAEDKQILMNNRALVDVEQYIAASDLGQVTLKGISKPVHLHRVEGFVSATT